MTIGALCVALTGCGEDRGLVPVRGRVTFDGQPPPKSGQLNFGPLESAAGYGQRPAQAKFDAEGNFVASSYQPGDGLTPGRYRINVYCVEREPRPVPGDYERVTYVARDYKGQEVVVEDGSEPIELAVDVPLKKRQ